MLSKILLKCKNSFKQVSKPSLKTNVNLTEKLSKANLKYIEIISFRKVLAAVIVIPAH